MTQQRDAQEDLNTCKLGEGYIIKKVLPYWIKEAEAQRIRADKAEQLINKLDKAVNEDDELDEWDYSAILIRKEITAYREGSNTEAKRD